MAGAAAFELRPGGGLVATCDVAAGTTVCFPDELRFTQASLRAQLATLPELADVWSVCEPVPGEAWALPHAAVRAVRHVDAAGAASVAVEPLATGCCLRLLRPLRAGEEALRDAAPTARTVSRAAALLRLLPAARWANAAERAALEVAVAGASRALPPPRPPFTGTGAELPSCSLPLVLYTDYALLAEELADVPWVSLTPDPATAAALWLMLPVADFEELGDTFINQFPFEGALVRKDLLPQTARAAAAATTAHGPHAFPPWSPPCYDLRTEAHHFLDAHAAGPARSVWVVKHAAGTRSSGVFVSDDVCCILAHGLRAGSGEPDRVAQAYVARPALLPRPSDGALVKFDCRVYVAVRSFAPLEAAMDARLYARLAQAPFSMAPEALGSPQTHLTVGWYADGGSEPSLLGWEALATASQAQGWDWAATLAATRQALRALFAAAPVPAFPYGRALYGVDVMFSGDGVLQPNVLEVNYCGDLKTLLRRMPGGAPGFAAEVVRYLFVDGSCDGGHLQPL